MVLSPEDRPLELWGWGYIGHSTWPFKNEIDLKCLNMSSLYPRVTSCRTYPKMVPVTLKSKFPGMHISILRRHSLLGSCAFTGSFILSLNAKLVFVRT